jgi:SPP1 gp7 family putative phage head morphogenesis protein
VPSVYEISQAFRAALLQRDRTAAARLISAYGVSFQRLQDSLARLTKQIEDARSRGEDVTEAWLYRQARFRELLDQASREMLALGKYSDGLISEAQRTEIERGLRDSANLMETAANEASINASFNRVPTSAVESVVGHLGDGSPLRGVLNRYGAEGAKRIEQELMAGLVAGEGLAKVARRLRDVEELSRAKAMSILRTESLRAYREASRKTYQKNDDLLSGWRWISAKQSRTCLACLALDNTFFPLDKPMPSHPNCRCVMVPEIKGEPPRQRETAAEWFAKQPDSVKRESMTDDELEAFNAGRVTLRDFVGRTDSEKWGPSYHQLSLKQALAGKGKFPSSQPPAVTPKPVSVPPARPTLTGAEARKQLLDLRAQYGPADRKAVLDMDERARVAERAVRQAENEVEKQAAVTERNRIYRENKQQQDSLQEKYRVLLYQDEETQIEATWGHDFPNRSELETGVAAFQKLIGKKTFDRGAEVEIHFAKNGRAYFVPQSRKVFLHHGSDASKVAHEFGHWLEDNHAGIFNDISLFLQRRTLGEKAVKLRDLVGDSYQDHEITRPDKFLDPYIGRVYEDKDGKRYASEVLAVGLEYFYKAPGVLALKDPDMFDFIYDLLRKHQ